MPAFCKMQYYPRFQNWFVAVVVAVMLFVVVEQVQEPTLTLSKRFQSPRISTSENVHNEMYVFHF